MNKKINKIKLVSTSRQLRVLVPMKQSCGKLSTEISVKSEKWTWTSGEDVVERQS